MKISDRRYTLIICFQLALVLIDICFNVLSSVVTVKKGFQLTGYIIQDALQLVAFVILSMSVFQTSVFEAGFVELLYKKFRITMLTASVYFLSTVSFQSYDMILRWSSSSPGPRCPYLSALQVLQWTGSKSIYQ
ncbi:transmembrane protein 138 isoform X3 [Bemisia tabaci]|uniref:transmembrane protein 138 isoform X3 n=1 Tax=Bemisia tabaci TaxID=7038 RepID=UPI003B28D753